MTVSTATSKIAYTGNGATTLFAFPYPFIASSDLQVYVAGVLKTLTTDYTISGSAPYPAGANITFLSAPANLASIVIIRVRPFTQTLDLVANDPLPAEDVERDFDHAVMLCQQLNEQASRAITIPSTDVTGTNTTLPAAAARANLALVFDAAGNATVGSSTTTSISAAMIPVVQAATLALARVAMGIGSNFTTEAVITAAATTDLGTLASQEVAITGSTGITSFGSSASLAAPYYMIRFTSSVTLTHSAALTIAGSLPWAAVSGDMAIARYEGSGNWRVWPVLGSGKALINPTGALTGITGINGGQLGGFRNKLINGDFRRWDYATTFTYSTAAAYGSANRWGVQGGAATGILNQDTSITTGLGFRYNAKLGRNNASANVTQITMGQAIKTENSIPLAGQQVTLSFYAKAGANFSAAANAFGAILSTGQGNNQSLQNAINGAWTSQAQTISGTATLTTSWQRFQFTATLPAATTQAAVVLYYTPTGTAGADDNAYITGVQLEIGSVATPFEDRGDTIEELLCFHHLPQFVSNGTVATLPGSGIGTSATNCTFFFPYKVRSYGGASSISVSAASQFTLFDGTGTTVSNGITINSRVSLDGLMIDVGAAAGLTQFRPYFLYANNSSGKILALGCEL